MLTDIFAALGESPLADDIKARLQLFLYTLDAAVSTAPPSDCTWLVAGATPLGSILYGSNDWPLIEPDMPTDKITAAQAINYASEHDGMGESLFRGIALVLGVNGL